MWAFKEGDLLTIQPKKRISAVLAEWYTKTMRARIEEYAPQTCILDFSQVDILNKAGIDVIRNVLHTMEERNGKLLICGLQEQPLKVFLESEVSEKIEIAEKSE